MENTLGSKATNYGKEVIRNVQGIAGYSMIGLAVGLASSFMMAGSFRAVGILAIAALACYAIGSGFGFLFSIPRSAQPDGGAPAAATDAAGRKIIPRDNTNLEQISDWLVKILIGASLVQLGEVKKLLDNSAAKLSASLSAASGDRELAKGADNAFAAGSTNGIPAILGAGLPAGAGDTSGFCVFLILYFLGLGFFTGYLITKLWLPFVMLRTAVAMEHSQLEADEERARKEGARAALRSFGITTTDPPPQSAASTATTAGDDPHRGKFGGKPEANGLRLTAKVQKMDDIDEDYFRITLKVAPVSKRNLDKTVTFHLHPTFDPAVVPVTPIDNEATLPRAAWGAFTVGATIDGEDTRLELDLAELPDAPALFKSR